MSLEGSTLDVADTRENEKARGLPGASRGESAFPKIRFVALLGNGTMCCGRRGGGRWPPTNSPWRSTWWRPSAKACFIWPTVSFPAAICGNERPRRGRTCYGGSAGMPVWRSGGGRRAVLRLPLGGGKPCMRQSSEIPEERFDSSLSRVRFRGLQRKMSQHSPRPR